MNDRLVLFQVISSIFAAVLYTGLELIYGLLQPVFPVDIRNFRLIVRSFLVFDQVFQAHEPVFPPTLKSLKSHYF